MILHEIENCLFCIFQFFCHFALFFSYNFFSITVDVERMLVPFVLVFYLWRYVYIFHPSSKMNFLSNLTIFTQYTVHIRYTYATYTLLHRWQNNIETHFHMLMPTHIPRFVIHDKYIMFKWKYFFFFNFKLRFTI